MNLQKDVCVPKEKREKFICPAYEKFSVFLKEFVCVQNQQNAENEAKFNEKSLDFSLNSDD